MNKQEEIYIAANSQKFRIKQQYKPQFGIFWLSRIICSVSTENAKIWQIIMFFALFTLPFFSVALILDIAALCTVGVAWIIKQLSMLIFYCMQYLFKTFCDSFVATVLKLATVLTVLIFTIYKWDDIKNIILSIF